MGLEIIKIDNTPDGNKRAQLLMVSGASAIFTSVIAVQARQRVNIGIVVGTQISDILSAAAFSATISQLTSVFSTTVTLQRRMLDETADYNWRLVAEWAISSSAAGEGGSETITTSEEPETVQYRAGIVAGDNVLGVGHLRIGTN